MRTASTSPARRARDVSYGLDALVKMMFQVDISGKKVTTRLDPEKGLRVINADGVDITGTPEAGAAWRLRYSELDGIPVSQWPPEARQYAIDDASWARKAYEWQEGRRQPRHH